MLQFYISKCNSYNLINFHLLHLLQEYQAEKAAFYCSLWLEVFSPSDHSQHLIRLDVVRSVLYCTCNHT